MEAIFVAAAMAEFLSSVLWFVTTVTSVVIALVALGIACGGLDPSDFDTAADALEQFSQMQFLQVTDPGLPGRITQRLGRFTTLRALCTQQIPFTDDDLRRLANLQNLRILGLWHQRPGAGRWRKQCRRGHTCVSLVSNRPQRHVWIDDRLGSATAFSCLYNWCCARHQQLGPSGRVQCFGQPAGSVPVESNRTKWDRRDDD